MNACPKFVVTGARLTSHIYAASSRQALRDWRRCCTAVRCYVCASSRRRPVYGTAVLRVGVQVYVFS